MRKLGLARQCSDEKVAAGRNPQARPRLGSGSRRWSHLGLRQRPGPGGHAERSVGQRQSRAHPLCTIAPGKDEYLGVMAEGQCGDLLGVAKPVLLGTRVQVFHHHQAAACVSKEAYRQEGCPRAAQL